MSRRINSAEEARALREAATPGPGGACGNASELLRRGAYAKGGQGGRRLLPSAGIDDARALEARAP